jgi:hypothetical protein
MCRRDAGGRDALARYDALAATLRRGPLTYDFVDATGRVEKRSFGLDDLETAVAGSIHVGSDRMLLQRAIAWAARGQLLPLARLSYIARGQDPETLAAVPNPGWSKAMFYGLECTDYAFGFGTGDEAARAYLEAGTAAAVADVRVGSVFYGDLPCAYWPAHPSTADRPEYLTSTPYPVFVLTSTTDAATPYAGALRIMSHLTDGYLVVQPDGPHVIFGRGTACVDDPVAAYLVDGVLPGTRFVTCDSTGTARYVPIPAAAAGEYRDALAAMSAVDDELTTSAPYRKWNRVAPLAFGCLFGGSLTYTPSSNGSTVVLDACAVSDGLPLTGTATIEGTRGTHVLKVSGPRTTGLEYARDARGRTSVIGTYFGKPVSLTGQAVVRANR